MSNQCGGGHIPYKQVDVLIFYIRHKYTLLMWNKIILTLMGRCIDTSSYKSKNYLIPH